MRTGWTVTIAVLAAVLFGNLSGALAADTEVPGLLDHELVAIEGGPLPLRAYEGHPVLLVNTASFCGFTRQYSGLQALWERYRDRGFVLLGVPSNDFGSQEPGSNAEIKEFCAVNFAIDFPMSEKVEVVGPGSHPLFHDLRSALGDEAGPRWNFYKYLLDDRGRPVRYWPSSVEPNDPAIIDAIEALLPRGS